MEWKKKKFTSGQPLKLTRLWRVSVLSPKFEPNWKDKGWALFVHGYNWMDLNKSGPCSEDPVKFYKRSIASLTVHDILSISRSTFNCHDFSF